MQEKKVYLLTEEQMQSFTDKLCQLSKELNVPAQEKKVTILGNELAQLPSVSSKDKFDVLIDKIVKAMGLRKEGQQ
jgi:phosphoribosylaminoimidazole (AIR) synthetase